MAAFWQHSSRQLLRGSDANMTRQRGKHSVVRTVERTDCVISERKKLICEKNCFILISDSNECHFCVQDSRNGRNVEKFA